MKFVDIELPRQIALGAGRRAAWSTELAQTQSGFENTNQNWAHTRHRYDISYAVRRVPDYQVIAAHFHAMRGRAKAFPFLDALDYRAQAVNGILIAGQGSPVEDYQLGKVYGSGDDRYERKITRPKAGTVAVYRTRAGVISDITSSCTIDYTTGRLTIAGGVVNMLADSLSWSGEFRVPCRYDTDELPGVIQDRRPGTVDYDDLLVKCESIPLVEVRE